MESRISSCWPDDLVDGVIFFFASTAASSAYLTVSETFPIEVRALVIAFFYAIGTGIGGVAGPWLLGVLIDTGSRMSVFGGYLLGASLMTGAAAIAARFCMAAERKPLELVAQPLSVVDYSSPTSIERHQAAFDAISRHAATRQAKPAKGRRRVPADQSNRSACQIIDRLKTTEQAADSW
jgi:MFS family permease